MTVNLMISDNNQDRAANDWSAINAVANNGHVFLANETVDEIATLLESATLSNGELLSSYPADGSGYESYVSSFGPGLLDETTMQALRRVLSADANGAQAIAMLDLIVERGLQITLNGDTHHFKAHLKAVNWPADDVEINRTTTNMIRMFRDLGLDAYNQGADGMSKEVPFDAFMQAVNDNGNATDMPDRLRAFVTMGQRRGAQAVYWA